MLKLKFIRSHPLTDHAVVFDHGNEWSSTSTIRTKLFPRMDGLNGRKKQSCIVSLIGQRNTHNLLDRLPDEQVYINAGSSECI